jgi:hypothetical protein
MNDAGLHQVDHRLMAGKRRAGQPDEILDAELRGGLESHECHLVTVSEMVVRRDHHAVPEATPFEGGLQVLEPLVPVHRVIDAGRDRRAVPGAGRPVLPDSFIGNLR